MKLASTYITLDGLNYSRNELLRLCRQKTEDLRLPQWQKDIFVFILSWLDESDHIEIQTSGSTGAPKPIKLKKQWMVNSATATCNRFNLNETSKALLCLPAKYIAGRMMIVRAIVSRCDLLTIPPESIPLQDTGSEVDFAAVTPHQLYNSIENAWKGKNVKTLIVGGGEISTSLERRIMNMPAEIYATYGMTETSSHIALRRINGPGSTNWFTVLEDISISADERNCLVIDAPELNDQILTTNDIIEIKDEQHFRWLGRWDNVINSGGIKIIPESIEKIISGIRPERLVIVPFPDDKFGEIPVLVIETETIGISESRELLDRISTQTDKYSAPKRIISLRAFPETPTGKPDRKRIVELIKDLHS
ncbi:MAG: AMP-binding protein [Bacteroidales bacterium]